MRELHLATAQDVPSVSRKRIVNGARERDGSGLGLILSIFHFRRDREFARQGLWSVSGKSGFDKIECHTFRRRSIVVLEKVCRVPGVQKFSKRFGAIEQMHIACNDNRHMSHFRQGTKKGSKAFMAFDPFAHSASLRFDYTTFLFCERDESRDPKTRSMVSCGSMALGNRPGTEA